MSVVVRFAPSPTGFLHIGGARTALFNWAFARHHGGKMLLRVEDTDRNRSSEAAVEAIYDGLRWLGMDWDSEAISQFSRVERHAEVAHKMLADGNAYYCYCSPKELAAMREKARAEKRNAGYDGTWRDRDASEAPQGVAPTIRLKAPKSGEIAIDDLVQGSVTVKNEDMDDMILLRSDGTPTYMLAVVVDDHDMGITHVIRGDDHLTNAFRQAQIFAVMGWDLPEFAHIPLIHGPDGAKLSKRHGALGVDAYRDMGYLPEAMLNYLMRLGWGHGDDEVFSMDHVVEWFDLANVGKSPARFDFDKLRSLNAHYIKSQNDDVLATLIRPLVEENLSKNLNDAELLVLTEAMGELKERAKTLPELAESTQFYFSTVPLTMIPKAAKLLSDDARHHLDELSSRLETIPEWSDEELHTVVKSYAEAAELKLGKIAQPLRAALTGSNVSPGIFDVLQVMGRDESLSRIKAAAAGNFQQSESDN